MNPEEKAKEKAKEQAKLMEQLIAKTWADEAFKQRLISNPAAVLKEAGLEAPEGIELRVVEDTDKVVHLVLPPKPSSDELSEEQLSNAAGGYWGCGCGGSYGSYGCYRRHCCC